MVLGWDQREGVIRGDWIMLIIYLETWAVGHVWIMYYPYRNLWVLESNTTMTGTNGGRNVMMGMA